MAPGVSRIVIPKPRQVGEADIIADMVIRGGVILGGVSLLERGFAKLIFEKTGHVELVLWLWGMSAPGSTGVRSANDMDKLIEKAGYGGDMKDLASPLIDGLLKFRKSLK